MATARAIPEGFTSISPHLTMKNASDAIEFYRKAFDARLIERVNGPGGKGVMHASMKIGNAAFMVNDEFPDWGVVGPESIGGSPVTIHIYVDDVDAFFKRAVDAGATEAMPVQDTFWGDRYGKLKDPFGHQWSVATHVRDMTPEEIERAAAAAFGG